MPSKTKKHQSKSQSKLSQQSDGYGSSSPSPLTSSISSLALPTHNSETCDHEPLLSEASKKFPSLIGKSAVIGRITEVESQSKGCRIWLSESSMVSARISPGSTVSVSLPSSKEAFPLASFSDEYAGYFDISQGKQAVDSAGNYFALATVFPSSKVQKNGVRLSLNLSRSMGWPALGREVFVHLIQSRDFTTHMHTNGKRSSSVAKCKELVLEVVPSRGVSVINNDIMSPFKGHTDPTSVRLENGKASSPRTPQSHRSMIRSLSPMKSHLSATKDSSLESRNIKGVYFNSSDITEVLADESVKKLLQCFVASWLCSHSVLCGNILTVPLLSKLCVFRVIGTKRLSDDSVTKELGCSAYSMYHENDAFALDHETMVHICLPSNLTSDIEVERSLTTDVTKYSAFTASMGDEIVKLGGLQKEYALLMDIISGSAKNVLSSLGLRGTKGVLLHGPPGTGKTSLVHLCARDAGVSFFRVNGPEIISQYHGESEQALHKIFESASQVMPSVIFIDELDAIAPARKEGGEELSQRIVATLLNLMDGISTTDELLVMAATNRLEIIEPALRRPGRLDREVEIGVPSPEQRLDILLTILNGMNHSLTSEQVRQLAVVTHAFVGADLAALCNEAGMVRLRHYASCEKSHNIINADMVNRFSKTQYDVEELFLHGDLDSLSSNNTNSMAPLNTVSSLGSQESTTKRAEVIQNAVTESNTCAHVVEEDIKLEVAFEDFEKARIKVRPSAMREVILEVPKVKWEDVGGQEEVKTQLMEAVEWPQKHQDAFKRIGTRPPTGVLLFGPPGCSKTLMARAVASEAGLNFLSVKGPELFSKWVGESEKAVRSLFAKARANAPSIIFFDEIDSLAVIRGKGSDGVSVADRVMSQLLVELDGLHKRVDVTVVAATNRPDKIDPALLRPGRFDRLLYVGPPTANDREDIFRIHLQRIPCSSDVDIKELAQLTKGCTGADISLICREAAISAIQESLDASAVTMEHLKSAIERVVPSEILPYQGLSEKFQRLVYSVAKPDEPASQLQQERSNWLSFRNPLEWIRSNVYGFGS